MKDKAQDLKSRVKAARRVLPGYDILGVVFAPVEAEAVPQADRKSLTEMGIGLVLKEDLKSLYETVMDHGPAARDRLTGMLRTRA